MNYTDKQLLRSAQIAYYDINDNVIAEINDWIRTEQETSGNYDLKASYTLSELYEHSTTFKDSIYSSLTESIGVEGFTVNETTKISDIFELDEVKDNEAKKVAISEVFSIINEIKTGELGSWKLVSFVFNDDVGKPGVAGKLKADGSWDTDLAYSPSGDGLCAYVFETSDDITALCYYNLAFAS